MTKPVALITGASSGIGAELARVFSAEGYDLVVTARRERLLQALADELADRSQVHIAAVDLSKARAPQQLARIVSDLGLQIDVLVNNAGVIETVPLLQTPAARITNLINLNVRALTELTHLYGTMMVERGYGRILNVASVAAFQPVPGMSVYAASKAFVLSLTESLSEELHGTGVTVSALCPGPTRTEMAAAFEQEAFSDWFLADAHAVAREGFDACRSAQVIRIPGIANQALVNWSHFQPRWLVRTLGGLASRTSSLAK